MKMELNEMKVETISFDTRAEDSAKAARRMALICAGPADQKLYRFNPNGARRNEQPGQPFADNDFPPYSE